MPILEASRISTNPQLYISIMLVRSSPTAVPLSSNNTLLATHGSLLRETRPDFESENCHSQALVSYWDGNTGSILVSVGKGLTLEVFAVGSYIIQLIHEVLSHFEKLLGEELKCKSPRRVSSSQYLPCPPSHWHSAPPSLYTIHAGMHDDNSLSHLTYRGPLDRRHKKFTSAESADTTLLQWPLGDLYSHVEEK
ncbi:hypothetical protein BDQ17DRAFT_1412587 [Cyathus striatus]|nr:hypothetical protein BDQ17DRAFT_1412587 [Cyathus striatus]